MVFYFVGIFCALVLTVALVMDLERKRVRLRRIALRLEQITSGKVRSRVRHVRRMTLSTFMYEQLIQQMHAQIAAVERDSGIETIDLSDRDWFFLENRLRQFEERVERLAQVLASADA